METTGGKAKRTKPVWRKWLHRIFVVWFIFSTCWLVNSYRTQGVDSRLLQSDALVNVRETAETFQLSPNLQDSESPPKAGLIFVCGSGVSSHAYVPMLRPLSEAGYQVHIVKLPYRLAPLESHKLEAMDRVHRLIGQNPDIESWVLGGHSLGAVLSCRTVQDRPGIVSALVLVGTTHPRDFSLANLEIPVTKVYATKDGVAPEHKIKSNAHLLPPQTRWVQIEGGNHSQFGHYGSQLFDGQASISREEQQKKTRDAIEQLLQQFSK